MARYYRTQDAMAAIAEAADLLKDSAAPEAILAVQKIAAAIDSIKE